MKMFKTVLSLVMCAILTLSVMPMSAAADSALPAIVVKAPDEVNPGDTVEVTISLENNPGIATMRLYVEYDSDAFTLTNVADAGILGAQTHKPVGENIESHYTLFWFNPLLTQNIEANGTIVTLTFQASDDVLAGNYEFAASYDFAKKDVIDANLNAVKFNIENSEIAVADVGQGSATTPDDILKNIKFRSKTVTYNGKSQSIEVTGIPAGADVEVEYDGNKATNVGTYEATATVSAGGKSKTLEATLTIEKKSITITGLTAKDKTYDGNTAAKLSGGKLSGVISGDDVSATMPTTGTFETAEVGDDIKVTFSKPKLKGADAGNYTLTLPTVKASILAEGSTVIKPAETTAPAETTEPAETVTPAGWVNPFTDVKETDWYYGAVKFASENGIMSGVAGDRFAPTDKLTRAMFVTVLYRIAGSPNARASAFTDVAAGSWYEAAVNWASNKGIVTGTSATTFSPDAVITREQMAAILHRYAKYKEYDLKISATPIFADGADIADWAKESMNWTTDKGLITGVGDNKVAPKADASRAEAAIILQRMIEKFGK